MVCRACGLAGHNMRTCPARATTPPTPNISLLCQRSAQGLEVLRKATEEHETAVDDGRTLYADTQCGNPQCTVRSSNGTHCGPHVFPQPLSRIREGSRVHASCRSVSLDANGAGGMAADEAETWGGAVQAEVAPIQPCFLHVIHSCDGGPFHSTATVRPVATLPAGLRAAIDECLASAAPRHKNKKLRAHDVDYGLPTVYLDFSKPTASHFHAADHAANGGKYDPSWCLNVLSLLTAQEVDAAFYWFENTYKDALTSGCELKFRVVSTE